jgi:hypothetical protein
MAGTLADLKADVQSYTSYDEPDFVAQIPMFIRQAEERAFYFVQLPNFRRSVTGTFTASNQYLQLPDDFLAPASLAIIRTSGAYEYLLNKDVNYIRAVFPNPTTTGEPTHYALFDASADDTTILVGPTPDLAYSTELHYFYKPASLTLGDIATTTTWLSLNAYDTLLYGTLDEASTWMKKNAGIDNMGETYSQRFALALQGLKNLGESRDRKDVYRGGEKRKPE